MQRRDEVQVAEHVPDPEVRRLAREQHVEPEGQRQDDAAPSTCMLDNLERAAEWPRVRMTSEESRTRGWTSLEVDLSRYAGPKISVFYQPDRRRWRVVFGTNIVAGSPAVAYWGTPGIDTDSQAARRFYKDHTAAAR